MILVDSTQTCGCVLSRFRHVQLCVTPWTVARQAPLFIGFSREEYWSELPFLSPGGLPDPGIEPCFLSLHCQGDSLPLHHLGSPSYLVYNCKIILEKSFSVFVKHNIKLHCDQFHSQIFKRIESICLQKNHILTFTVVLSVVVKIGN